MCHTQQQKIEVLEMKIQFLTGSTPLHSSAVGGSNTSHQNQLNGMPLLKARLFIH